MEVELVGGSRSISLRRKGAGDTRSDAWLCEVEHLAHGARHLPPGVGVALEFLRPVQ